MKWICRKCPAEFETSAELETHACTDNQPKGKAHRHRSTPKGLKDSDFFETPYSLPRLLLEVEDFGHVIREPAAGNWAMVRSLAKEGKSVFPSDISNGQDFLSLNPDTVPALDIITNPPFSLFDEFVLHAQKVSRKFAFIFQTNYFGAKERYYKGVWKHLKHLYIFNRQVDYRGPIYEDGTFHVGGLVTGWGVWDMAWNSDRWTTSIMDVQKYATRGQFVPCLHCGKVKDFHMGEHLVCPDNTSSFFLIKKKKKVLPHD